MRQKIRCSIRPQDIFEVIWHMRVRRDVRTWEVHALPITHVTSTVASCGRLLPGKMATKASDPGAGDYSPLAASLVGSPMGCIQPADLTFRRFTNLLSYWVVLNLIHFQMIRNNVAKTGNIALTHLLLTWLLRIFC